MPLLIRLRARYAGPDPAFPKHSPLGNAKSILRLTFRVSRFRVRDDWWPWSTEPQSEMRDGKLLRQIH